MTPEQLLIAPRGDSPSPQTASGSVTLVSDNSIRSFTGPTEIITATCVEEVIPSLHRIDDATRSGAYAAGFVTYESAPAFDPAIVTHPPNDLPLLWFGLYDRVDESQSQSAPGQRPFTLGPWTPCVSQQDFERSVNRIRDYIAAGDSYQVNYTFPMEAAFEGSPAAWFEDLRKLQRTKYSAYINTGRFTVLSVSPELFFNLRHDALTVRPMKGTWPRGRWSAEDRVFRERLRTSEKDRAENVMIVDMLRNDVGRISLCGSVHVDSLFDVERYETLWQMTSTIRSKTSASIPELFAALFPSGSVTGAPKIRTMEIIRELEPYPRGVYCGAIGWCGPGNEAEFNVAIRTAVVDTQMNTARYHVGSGVTWGSTPLGEYEESILKGAVLSRRPADFQLLETMRYEGGYFLLEDHLERLKSSAEYFGFTIRLSEIRRALQAQAEEFPPDPLKVRLTVDKSGAASISWSRLDPPSTMRVALAAKPINESDVSLYHKTTQRKLYEDARNHRPDCDDVLLWNRRGELTETTIANIALLINGQWHTPPLASGLLPGVMRAHLLREGTLHESLLTKEDLARADEVLLFNSVRKTMKASLVA